MWDYVGQRFTFPVKGKELSDKKKELEDVNRKQKAIAKVKSEFDGLKPDIVLICEKLVLFADIWNSVGFTDSRYSIGPFADD